MTKIQSALILLSVLAATSSTIAFSQQPSTPLKPSVELLEILPIPEQSPVPVPVPVPEAENIVEIPPIQSDDPRTRLLNSSDRIGFGASTTGGSNYVYVKTFSELKAALEQDGNYVILDPSLAGQEIAFTDRIWGASNITLDGSLAPGHSFVAGPSMPSNFVMLAFGGSVSGNVIIHSIKFDGKYSKHGIEQGALALQKGTNYWIDHCEITDFLDDSLTMGTSVASAADYITAVSYTHLTLPTIYSV